MSETVIRIRDDGKVQVESDRNGVKNFKQITPDSLVKCIDKSRLQGALHTGLLPKHCLSFSAFHDGSREAVLTHPENSAVVALLDCHKPTLICCHKLYLRNGYGKTRNIFSIA